MYHESEQYYHFATLKNQINEELDNQITHIIVEISKFEKSINELSSDLDKLIYFMKNLQQLIEEADLPKTLSEDWIKIAMERLDESNLSPEDRMAYEMMMARNASLIAERKLEDLELTEQVTEQVKEQVTEQVTEQVRLKHAKEMKEAGIDFNVIAKITGFTVEEIELL
jgi:predicted transposase/invertase (TIGR01784 family)